MIVEQKTLAHIKSYPLLVVYAFQEPFEIIAPILDKKTADSLKDIAESEGFKGKQGEVISIPAPRELQVKRVYITGLGKKEEFTKQENRFSCLETIRRATSSAARKAQNTGLTSIAFILPEIKLTGIVVSDISQAAIEGIGIGTYRFDKYITTQQDKKPNIAGVAFIVKNQTENAKLDNGVKLGLIMSEAANFARDLVNEPASVVIPERLAEHARRFAGPNIEVTVYNREQLEQMGMQALLAVSKGSNKPPVFIHLLYKPKGAQTSGNNQGKDICIVGKGITFDSGGLSLKPAESMETMKMDMSGAAAILGVFKILTRLMPKVTVHGIIPATENMPGGGATKPGDIVKAYNGKTIEILNTDAEGRLILADALSYAAKLNPREIIDLATLTGACVVALGANISGILSNNKALVDKIKAAGDYEGEKIWELPLEQEYMEQIKSKVADLKNISSVRREAGATIGGLFLQEFAGNGPWAHLDIAGPAWATSDSALFYTGATGVMVRTLIRHILAK